MSVYILYFPSFPESIPETVTVEYWVGYLTAHEARGRMSAMQHLPCY